MTLGLGLRLGRGGAPTLGRAGSSGGRNDRSNVAAFDRSEDWPSPSPCFSQAVTKRQGAAGFSQQTGADKANFGL